MDTTEYSGDSGPSPPRGFSRSPTEPAPAMETAPHGAAPGAPPPYDPFAEAQAALSRQWALLSKQLEILGGATESEVFAGLVQRTLDLFDQAGREFSSLQGMLALEQGSGSHPSPRAVSMHPELLAAQVDERLKKHLEYMHSGGFGGTYDMPLDKGQNGQL